MIDQLLYKNSFFGVKYSFTFGSILDHSWHLIHFRIKNASIIHVTITISFLLLSVVHSVI